MILKIKYIFITKNYKNILLFGKYHFLYEYIKTGM
jgi:hypothetical protein